MYTIRTFLTLSLLCFGFLVIGQNKETRKIKDFVDLSVQGPFKVELSRGQAGELTITSEMIPTEEIITEVAGNGLNIRLKTRAYLKEEYYDQDYILVRLPYEQLEEIDASMGTILKVKEKMTQDYLRLECTMGAEVYVEVEVDELDCKVTMGGILEVKGNANYADVQASMGGEFLGDFLTAEKADLRAGMGGEVTIGANEKLDGSASMGGIIRYNGKPDRKSTSTILGGEIYRTRKNN